MIVASLASAAFGDEGLALPAPSERQRVEGSERQRVEGPSYAISVVLDPDRATLQGHQILQMWNRSGGAIDHVDLHLHANAYRNGSTVFAEDRRRSLAAYEDPRVAVPSEDSGGSITVQSLSVNGRAARFVVDGTLLRVPLETSLPRGQSLLVELDFTVRIPRYRDRLAVAGSNFVIGAWFPKLPPSLALSRVASYGAASASQSGQRRGLGEFFSDIGDYDVSITVPKGFVVGATGSEVERRTNANGTETSRWRAARVRDFAWVADRNYRVSEGTWRPPSRGRFGETGVRIRYLSLPGHEQAASGLKIAIEALDTFSNTFGEYPYDTFTVAEAAAIRSGTGVEYPQFVLVSRDLAASAGFSSGFESILVHEVAHQWWYGVVGSHEVEEPWLDEALAAYSTRRHLRSKYGREPPMYRWPKPLGFLPSPTESAVARFMYASRARAGFDEPIDQPAPDFGDRPGYTVSVYYKGAAVLEMLEYLVGTPTFERILRTYFAENAYRNARITDFIDVAERDGLPAIARSQFARAKAGATLGTFFEQWLEGTSTCDYSVDGIDVNGDESAIRVRRLGAIVIPVLVRATLEDGSRVDLEWEGQEAHTTLTVKSAKRVQSVRLDPERRLLETDIHNNHFPRRRVWSLNPASMPDDAVSVAWTPFAWYGDGYGVGSLIAFGGPPEFGFPYGVRRKHGTSAVIRRNLKDDTTSLRVAYATPLDMRGSRGLLGATIGLRPGQETGSVRFRWFIGKHFYQAPTHTIEISATHDRETFHRAIDEASRTPFDAGTVRSITSRYVFNRLETDYFPLNGSRVDASVEAGVPAMGSDWRFARTTVRAETYRPLTSKSKLALAAAHGYATSGAPRQRALLVTSDGGFVSTGVRQIAGRHMTALNAELRTSISGSSLAGAGFVSLAKYWFNRSSFTVDTPHRVLSEAGIGLRLFDNAPFGMQIDWPLWVDTGREARRFTARRVVLRVGRVFERD